MESEPVQPAAEEEEEEEGIPSLLRAARGSYGNAIRAQLALAGFDDLPRNGAFVLGAVGNHGAPMAEAVSTLGASKQAGSQLVDTLVLRGYVERSPDPDDRRRLNVNLTDRGLAAAQAILRGVRSVDRVLASKLSPAGMRGLRDGLEALAEIARSSE